MSEILPAGNVMHIIDAFSFFKNFTKEEKKTIAEFKNSLVKFKNGEFIINEGAYDLSIYILLRGTAYVTKKSLPNAILSKLGPGDLFGELSLLAKRTRTTNIIAKGNVVALRWHPEFFDTISPELREKIKDQFLYILVNRLDHMNELVVQYIDRNWREYSCGLIK